MSKLKLTAHEERVYFCLNALRFGAILAESGYKSGAVVGADLSMSGAAAVCLTDGALSHVKTSSNQVAPFSRSSKIVYFEELSANGQWMFEVSRGSQDSKPLLCYEEITVSKNFGGMLGTARSQASFLAGWGRGFKEAYGEQTLLAIPVVNTQIKRFFGSGSMDKGAILEQIQGTMDIHFNDDNQADAFGAAILGFVIKEACFSATLIDKSAYTDSKAMREEIGYFSTGYESSAWESAYSVLNKPNFFNNIGLSLIHEKVRKDFLQLRPSLS